MSKWRWAVVWVALGLAVVLGVATSKRSYGYRFLTGQCFAKPLPPGCMPHVGRN